MIIRIVFLLFFSWLALRADCLPVRGEWITTSDLGPAMPQFTTIPVQPVSPAPLAGTRRTFTTAELRRVARRLGLADSLDLPPSSVCFSHPLDRLGSQQVAEAIARQAQGTAFELVEHSQFPVPPGELLFLISDWRPDRRDGTKLLRGYVRYAAHRRTPVWARVRPRLRSRGLVAAQELSAGVRLDERHVREEDLEPGSPPPVKAFTELAGRVTRHRIAAGAPLTARMLAKPLDVARGDRLEVWARKGLVALRMDSVAETGGAIGGRILVVNPRTGYKFKATVETAGRASLDIGEPQSGGKK